MVSRVRWAVLFALLLFAVVAAPVLASGESSGEVPPGEAPSSGEGLGLPIDGDTSTGIEAVELEEREQAEWLLSPEAIQQREASQDAFTGLSAGEAQSLLVKAFPMQLQELNADPARVLSELEIEKVLSTYGARISAGDGESAIVESAVPVQSNFGGGGNEPVDLALERSGPAFVPQNPLTKVELPGSAADPIKLHGGIEVELPTSGDHGAEPLGDKNLFIPETETATDTLIAPIAGGVEVFEQLRSPESPEEFRFPFSLPQGAKLQEGAHGAEVLSASDEMLEKVPSPTVVDAQGTDVPVTMSVEGDSLVIGIAHRSADVAYPLLLDPRYNEGYEAPPFSGWAWGSTGPYGAGNTPSSLLAYSQGNSVAYGANTFGQWEYNAPGETVYIENASFSPIYFYVNNCQTLQPHGYVGIFNVNSWSYNSLGAYSNGNISGASYFAGGGGVGTRKAIVGISTTTASTLKCAHEMWVGGVTVQENDPEKPTINSVSGIPSGWFNPAKAGNATISATDQGFGVDRISIENVGAGGSNDLVGCTGMWNSRCPRDRNWTIAPPYKYGERPLKVSAEDPTGKVGEWSTTTKVDASNPEVELSGQLAVITEQTGAEAKKQELGEDVLKLPVYNLHVKATDGNEKVAVEKQSGLKTVDVYLDGAKQKVPWEPLVSCPLSSCKIEGNFPLQLAGVTSGEHKLKVIAADQVGLEREREIDFEYFPATGMKDDYIMQRFPLPDSKVNEEGLEDPKRPELAVNVTNGNLVYHQRDVEIDGPAVDLEVERFYNSQLPKAASTEWGQGWTLAQTPELELEKAAGSPPAKAPMVRSSGVMQSPVGLPTETNQKRFDAKLQAVVTKEAGGGYDVADESGETNTSLAFDGSGKVTELRTPGYAKVDYSYEGGDLSEIAVDDPASAELLPEAVSAPVATGESAAEINQHKASLRAAIDPEGLDTTYQFEYGLDETYGAKAPASPEGIGSGGEPVAVSKAIEGLQQGTIYHFRVIATNGEGATYGDDTTFTTWGEWSLESPPNPEASKTSSLADVSCTSPTACLAVGVDSYAKRSLVEIWDGAQWTLRKGLADHYMTAVSCGSATVCWSVGSEWSGSTPLADTWYKEGKTWSGGQLSKPVIPTEATNVHLNGIACTGETECTAVGSYSEKGQTKPLVERVGASFKWEVQTTGLPANVTLEDISCASASACTAVGFQVIEAGKLAASFVARYDGKAWTPVSVSAPKPEAPEFRTLRSVSCPSATSCMTFGNVESKTGLSTFAASYDGSKWSEVSLGIEKGVSLAEVSCDAAGHCLAVGDDGKGHALVRSWDGSKWTAQTAPTPAGKTALLSGVSCTGTLACLAVGSASGGGETAPLAERYESRAPAVSTSLASGVAPEVATLNAAVDPQGFETHYQFEYGPTTSYGSAAPSLPQGAGSGTQELSVSAEVKNLDPGRLYHFRLVATSSIGTSYGEDRTFTTPPPIYAFTFGSQGTGEGQFASPSGIATDAEGNVYVADSGNHRVVRFNSRGDFVSQFGKEGSGEAQLAGISAIAVGPEGYVYIADSGNRRIKRFKGNGDFVSQFGAEGTGNGQFGSLIGGLAVDNTGVVWASDSAGHRVERFDSAGKYLSKFGTEGIGNGQFAQPRAIAIDGGGNAWVVDLGHERLEQFSPTGAYQRQLGKLGKGAGELNSPAGIATDAGFDVWVVDSGNNRLEEFSSEGKYLSQFGEIGSGEGQFSSPSGLAIDPQGGFLIVDAQSRIQKWFVLSHDAPSDSSRSLGDGDPSVKVATPGGLVESVEGEAVGEVTYAHKGQMLTAVDSDAGETKYEYDTATERLTKVTLPNGTWGKIEYEGLGRVKSVAVSIEGAKEKKTFFSYQDEPSRRTTVTPESEPITTYDIGADGSVLKWRNATKPPEIEQLTGSLWVQRGEVHPEPITIGDQTLLVPAYSAEGIASIQIVANGNQVVAEKTCKQDLGKEGTECVKESKELVTSTESWPPGILQLEVIVTDRENHVASQRFWVNIPYTPPPGSEAPDPPKFAEVLRFREEFGLDLDLKGNEFAINERIFELISLWKNPNSPAGEVARASTDRWGVPLRAVDAAELEYREQYLTADGPMIEKWGEDHAPGTYAGFYIDNRQGGIIHVGFTSSQTARLGSLKQELPLIAADRIATFESRPNRSFGNLYAASHDFNARVASHPELTALLTTGKIDVKTNRFAIGATNVGPVASFLSSTYGPNPPVVAVYDSGKPRQHAQKYLDEGVRARPIGDDRLFAGDWIRSGLKDSGGCTLAFGAYEATKRTSAGTWLFNNYGLTAGHCWPIGTNVFRGGFEMENGKRVEAVKKIGTVQRRSNSIKAAGFQIDSEAILLTETTELPKWIYWNSGYQSQINGASPWKPGQTLCYSGAWGRTHCGPTGETAVENWYEGESTPTLEIVLRTYNECGASGSPVWDPRTGSAVGLLVGGGEATYCKTALNGPTWVTPILPIKGGTYRSEEEVQASVTQCEHEEEKNMKEEEPGEPIDYEAIEALCAEEGSEEKEESEEVQPIPTGAAPGVLGAPTMDSPQRLRIVDPVK